MLRSQPLLNPSCHLQFVCILDIKALVHQRGRALGACRQTFGPLRSSVIRKVLKNFSTSIIFAATVLLFAPPADPAMREQSAPDSTETGVNVEASPQIFATMCALDAAGFDADESTL